MAKPAARIGAVQFVFVLGVLAILARAAQLQIVEGEYWAAEAERQRTERRVLPARRGAVYDRNGVPLAVTQEFYHVGIAPNELRDTNAVLRLIAKQLHAGVGGIRRDIRAGKRWIYFHGPYTATDVEPLRDLKGIHLDGEFRRFNPSRSLARPIVGALLPDGTTGGTGMELALDSLLTGIPGEAVLLKDRAGRRYSSPSRVVRDPVPGNDVTLTLDAELQEIAERALDDATATMGAEGGDVVFLDPSTGELLALASRQSDGAPRASTFTDPFEPGSTAKLFTAAALLTFNRVDSTDAVFAEGGEWLMPVTTSGRTRRITDSHKHEGTLTLAQAIQVSSNIAMAKFAMRLPPEEQFEMLRDFGFGTPTGAEFPSESRGRLARPHQWQPYYTSVSLAMGYELGVTAVQLAAAYGAIANDGLLLTPSLVREVRSPSGALLYRHQPEPVRQVVTAEVATRLREYLRSAAGEGGTGEQAQLATFSLLGKTGTAVRFRNGRYVRGEYTASFAALFPADDPQLAVIVKIDNPRGPYYGGLTAAPLTRTMLQQALASRRVAIDRGRLAAHQAPLSTGQDRADPNAAPPQRQVVTLPYRPADSAGVARDVPDVIGQPIREAAHALHQRGFRVNVRGFGTVTRMEPVSGDSVAPGTTVTLWTE